MTNKRKKCQGIQEPRWPRASKSLCTPLLLHLVFLCQCVFWLLHLAFLYQCVFWLLHPVFLCQCVFWLLHLVFLCQCVFWLLHLVFLHVYQCVFWCFILHFCANVCFDYFILYFYVNVCFDCFILYVCVSVCFDYFILLFYVNVCFDCFILYFCVNVCFDALSCISVPMCVVITSSCISMSMCVLIASSSIASSPLSLFICINALTAAGHILQRPAVIRHAYRCAKAKVVATFTGRRIARVRRWSSVISNDQLALNSLTLHRATKVEHVSTTSVDRLRCPSTSKKERSVA